MALKETWLPVLGFEDYLVSDRGRVRSLDRTIVASDGKHKKLKGKLLKPNKASAGYFTVTLYREKIPHQMSLSHLVYRTFIGVEVAEGFYILHRNGKKSNNSLSNLKMVSISDTNLLKWNNGTMTAGEQHPNAKLLEKQVVMIRELAPYLKHGGAYKLSELLNVSHVTISKVINNKLWNHVT
jgi:hypothetical protein